MSGHLTQQSMKELELLIVSSFIYSPCPVGAQRNMKRGRGTARRAPTVSNKTYLH